MASLLQHRLFDMILFLSAASLFCLSAGDTSRCPSSSKTAGSLYTYQEKCYQFILSEKTWVDARSYCYSKGAALMNLENRAKYNWAVSVLTHRIGFSNNGFWLGLHDRNSENRWEWDEGPGVPDVLMTWSNWQSGEPNDWTGQDCVYMRKGYNYRWVDVGCGDGFHINRNYAFACEHKMLPKTTTTTTTTPTTTTTTTTPTTTPPTTTISIAARPVTTPVTTTMTTPITTFPIIKVPTATPTITISILTRTTTKTTKGPITAQQLLPILRNDSITTESTNSSVTTIFEMLPETSSSPTTDKSTTKPKLVGANVVLPDSPDSQDLQGHDGKGKIAATGQIKGGSANVNSKQKGGDEMAVHVSIGLIVTLLIAILIIVLLVFKRRRDRKNLGLTHSLTNPCYVDNTCTNDLNGCPPCTDENGYATCRVECDGNVYVEMGDENIPALSVKSANDDGLSFSNQRYMALPPRATDINISAAENSANDLKAETNLKPERKSKYLDECGTYTEDGYMAPKHIYADVSDIVVPALSLVPAHYDVPEKVKSRQASASDDININVYEDPQSLVLDSQVGSRYGNLPVASGDHYDVPRKSQEIASGYVSSDSSRSDNRNTRINPTALQHS